MSEREMHLVAYLMVPTSHHQGGWRSPCAALDFLSPRYFERVARTLEDGLFDMVFMPDSLAIFDRQGGTFASTVAHGGQTAMQLDPLLIATIMGAATSRIGLGATISTTFFTPFAVARAMASLDHLSEGRAAWNVVSSTSTTEARNMGVDQLPPRGERYDTADEFLEAAFGLWDSWAPDALLLDKATGQFADADKVRYLDYEGAHHRSRGPLTVPRTPQGRPVIMQAGSSDRGREFAARWGEVIFTIQQDLPGMQAFYRDVKRRVQEAGRAPDQCKILAAVQPIVGETEQIARERAAFLNGLIDPRAAIAMVSSHVGVDLSGYALDAPLAALETEEGQRGSLDLIVQAGESEGLTLGEAAQRFAASEMTPQLVGTPAQIADHMEELFAAEGVDGFIVTPSHVPGSFDEFVRAVVPELQRRGLFRTAYAGETLRDLMGLETPARGERPVAAAPAEPALAVDGARP